jgi:hypothetical protein
MRERQREQMLLSALGPAAMDMKSQLSHHQQVGLHPWSVCLAPLGASPGPRLRPRALVRLSWIESRGCQLFRSLAAPGASARSLPLGTATGVLVLPSPAIA